MGFIQNDDTVLAEKGVGQNMPQQAAIRHVLDGSILKGSIRPSAVTLIIYIDTGLILTQQTHTYVLGL